jgi:hypothetical protein
MSESTPFDRATKAQPENEQQVIEKDTNNSPSSDETTSELQNDVAGSPAFDDPEIDRDSVTTLPGTGGPDDEGDIEIDPSDLNL